MAEVTGIAWTDSTFNPWIGCSAVSVEKNGGGGCDNCYAKVLVENRMGKDFATRWRTSATYWKQPLRWNKKAAAVGRRHLVFCASLADVFDNEVPEEWRADLWRLIRATPALTWLLLTKRIGNVAKMHPGGEYPNVWLGVSVVNQMEADRDLPKLAAVPAAVRFVSYEPALGPIDWREWLEIDRMMGSREWVRSGWKPDIGWIIVGGESAQGGALARSFNHDWARSTIEQCRAAGIPVFIKQLGSDHTALYERTQKDRAGANPAEWPEDLRVREFP